MAADIIGLLTELHQSILGLVTSPISPRRANVRRRLQSKLSAASSCYFVISATPGRVGLQARDTHMSQVTSSRMLIEHARVEVGGARARF